MTTDGAAEKNRKHQIYKGLAGFIFIVFGLLVPLVLSQCVLAHHGVTLAWAWGFDVALLTASWGTTPRRVQHPSDI